MEGPSHCGKRQSRETNDKENLKQSRSDDRRDIGRKNEILKHGIKGIKKITGKYNTSRSLTEVKISCPCGLKWTWQKHASPLTEQEREERAVEGGKSTSRNRNFLSKERLPPICHLWKPRLR